MNSDTGLSLRGRMLLAALLPVTLVAVMLTAAFLTRLIADLETGLRTRGAAISRQMATAAEFGIFTGQRDSLSALAEAALRSDPDARGTAIVDAQGFVMARSGEIHPSDWPEFVRLDGFRLSRDVLLFAEPVMRSITPVDDIYGGSDVSQAPAPMVIGHVVVELSPHAIAKQRDRLIASGVLIALFGAALGGWLARRIARGVTDPVLKATEVVEKIAEGDLAARVDPESAGALHALAAGINDMAARIGMSQEDLRARVAEATVELLQEKETAERATAAKSRFLASASHDLRQPLHALGLFVSSLAQTEAATKEPRLVEHIQSSVNTLQDLLDAILDISRLDGGAVVPRINAFPLSQVLDRLGRDLSPLAEQKGLRLKVRPTRMWAMSDRQIVERILLNLIGNALRYTTSGGALISCRRRGEHAVIEVWDTGEGIPEQAREEIFEEYVQLGNPERDRAKGLGLGLAICRRLAELLGAPMGVRSRPGRGSVFWLELPLAREASRSEVEARLPHAGGAPDLTRISGTVLVVEDDPLVRAGMEQVIVGWGATVMAAATRDEALSLCRESRERPDLAICDIRLPGLVSGIGLAEELQREFGRMAVLLVSADVSEEAQIAARRSGFPLLKKPVPPGRLRAALRQMLEVRSRSTQSPSSADSADDKSPA